MEGRGAKRGREGEGECVEGGRVENVYFGGLSSRLGCVVQKARYTLIRTEKTAKVPSSILLSF